ncbi:sugar efflux transporter [Vibrio vulnificus]|jgi:SET family sugar efflux transporter-like MFS transporter|uniref:sugar efflux transporter n=1 Tax=Vibrio vulnificus TaxID=672 RepID=UPI0002E71046|nr:sugar efflux transporter [Vibrio vulnificus]MCU8168105.1 sugar efflux transporter [Vibrio vulnificus]MCU8172662.1 sugar efflux transporter [Vibrio vulnificus]MCU8268644.1 sugar efflux transporter [Vibrio vulnificus]MDK2702023.1 sugar efflux transporter [Vibrio vulnificus]OQK46733.1 permease [Vibrio vulnificus]
MLQDRTAILFVITATIIGLCGAFFYPLTSLFLVEQLNASPMMLSLYMVVAVISSVSVSQVIAGKSDRGWQRKTILLISVSCQLVTVVSFIFIRDYWIAIAVVALLGSISGAAFGQLFALGREYGDKYVTDSASFVSTMRAGIAIAWVFGPPLAFLLKAAYGFEASFTVAAIVIALSILVIFRGIPNVERNLRVEKEPSRANGGWVSSVNPLVFIYCLIIVLAFAANNLYIVSMPLYLSQELKVDANWLGVLFGVAALCEIPVMLWAGKLARRWSALTIMKVGIASGVLFYSAMLVATNYTHLIVAQILNGIFIGTCATLGMVVMQDMMKDKLGTASTLFSNMLQLSMLVSSLSVGIVGELFNYYSSFYVSLLGVSLALILLICCQTKLAASSKLVPNSN